MSGGVRGPVGALSRAGLALLEGPYRLAVAVRNALYDAGVRRAWHAPVPVVSVGNLTLGGTGKTPMVEYVARRLLARDRNVVILSRGYGAEGDVNDEAAMLERRLGDVPHLQDPDRVRLARGAVREYDADVLLLDDAFQHRRLARDLDLVLLDATEPFGYGHVFPRGLLREPVRALRRADLVVLTRSDLCPADRVRRTQREVERHAPHAGWVVTRHRPIDLVGAAGDVQPLSDLGGAGVLAFAGIGNPQAFRSTLERAGARVIDWREFDDHHDYVPGDIADLALWAEQQRPDLVVTTEKDLVKIERHALCGVPLLAVRIEVEVLEGNDLLEQSLDEVLNIPS